jgi:hypothetical protein
MAHPRDADSQPPQPTPVPALRTPGRRPTPLPRAFRRALPPAFPRAQLGWIALALGAVLCFLGWYGASGERYAAQQLPYLASATAPGVALLLGGIVLLAARHAPDRSSGSRQQEHILRQLELLYGLLTEEQKAAADTARSPNGHSVLHSPEQPAASGPASPAAPAAAVALLAVPGGGTYHLADCLLLQGRGDPQPATSASIAQHGLRPCPLCEPPPAPEG